MMRSCDMNVSIDGGALTLSRGCSMQWVWQRKRDNRELWPPGQSETTPSTLNQSNTWRHLLYWFSS